MVKIISLTGTLSDSSKDGITTMGFSNVVNQLHNKHSLADTGTTEETNLTAPSVGSEQVDNLNTCMYNN